jgi:membrane fusion protein, multidrug efflux system
LKKMFLRSSALLLLISSLLFVSCKQGSTGSPPSQPGKRGESPSNRSAIAFPVEVQEVKAQSLVYSVNAVGSIEAFEKVQVTARVSGVVDRVLFSEGNFAKVNQVLVEIETERYRLAVEAAQAAYEKAAAALADAEAGFKRREAAVRETPGLIPGEEVETWRTKVSLAKSDVALAKAALNQANLNLHDAYVRAPFSGIIQTRTVQTGQYVETGMVLATLVRRDPLLLRFKVPERDSAQMHPGSKALFKIRDSEREYSSKIIHVAASADQLTRMVEVTAEINDTKDETLRPGAFAEVVVPISSSRMSPVVPLTAVRPSEHGFIAYVVENNTAAERILTLGMRTADGQVEVLAGLKPGEILVIRGGEALRSGALVKIGKAPDENVVTR